MTSGTSIPSEFDLELEDERRRWLRRRFLWFCAMAALSTIALGARDIYRHLFAGERSTPAVLQMVQSAISLSLYASAGAYAIFARKNPAALHRLAILLIVLVGLCHMAFLRIGIFSDPKLKADLARTPV